MAKLSHFEGEIETLWQEWVSFDENYLLFWHHFLSIEHIPQVYLRNSVSGKLNAHLLLILLYFTMFLTYIKDCQNREELSRTSVLVIIVLYQN